MDKPYLKAGLPINAMMEPYTSAITEPRSHSQELSEEEIGVIMNGIREIFQLDEELSGGAESMEDDDEEPEVDPKDQERRKLKLKTLLSTLAQLWWSDSEHMDTAAELLADGSRDRK